MREFNVGEFALLDLCGTGSDLDNRFVLVHIVDKHFFEDEVVPGWIYDVVYIDMYNKQDGSSAKLRADSLVRLRK